MARPRKRPRLQFMGSSSPEPDEDLAVARERNDNLLKSRWESIFQRYEREFDGVGDEIGVISGKIEVDNGHLRSMQDEKDVGAAANVTSTFDGRRMLRAMTIAPSDTSASIPDADEVLQSIETIAGNACVSGDSSEDDLFRDQSDAAEDDDDQDELSQEYYSDRHEMSPSPTRHGETSSLQHSGRSESVDSLFETGSNPMAAQASSSTTLEDPEVMSPDVTEMRHHYISTPAIRKQVRRVLDEERQHQQRLDEERVDPAWRIPIRIPSPIFAPRIRPNHVQIASTGNSVADVAEELESAMDLRSSIWQNSSRSRRSRKQVAADKNRRRIRAESEDPLQEGFSSETDDNAQREVGVRLARQVAEVSPSPSITPPRESLRPVTQGATRRSQRVHSEFSDASSRRVNSATTLKRRSKGAALSQAGIAVDDVSRVAETEGNGSHEGNLIDDYSETSNYDPPHEGDAHVEEKVEEVDDTVIVAVKRKYKIRAKKGPQQEKPAAARVSTKETAEEASKHPWEAPSTRSGKELSKLAKAIRKTAQGRFAKTAIRGDGVDGNDESAADDESSDKPKERDPAQERQRQELLVAEGDTVLNPLRLGQCFYCKIKYVDRHAVGAHWDRILINSAAKVLDKDDPHNLNFIRSVRSQVARRHRAPCTLVRDYRRMVELHEGGGWSFEEISDLRLLICRKSAEKLEEEYCIYRQPEVTSLVCWTAELEAKLDELLEAGNERLTMYQTHKQLGAIPEMSYVDIGNKMAEKILAAYNNDPSAVMDQVRKLRQDKKPSCYPRKPTPSLSSPRDIFWTEPKRPQKGADNPVVRLPPWQGPMPPTWYGANGPPTWQPPGVLEPAIWDEVNRGFWVATPHPWNMNPSQRM